MDPAETIDAVREDAATELDRLGSDKLLIALTDATLEDDAVRQATATRERAVGRAFEAWATDEADEATARAFADAAEAAFARADRIDAPESDVDAFASHLSTVEGTAGRVGAGLVAAPLLADRLYLQVVNFFVNEADERSANLFRDLRADAADLQPATDRLAAFDEDGRTVARSHAADAIEVAYADYADSLEAMGLDPRPVC
jgi:hypothetical protein